MIIEEEKPKDPQSFLKGITKYHFWVLLGCWLGGIFDGMDSSLMAVTLPAAVKDLVPGADQKIISEIGSYVTAIFLLGWTIGGMIFGIIGDKLGRVTSMILSILLYAIFTGLAGLTSSWEALAICRFLTGLGIGGEMVSIATFLTEVWPERSRTLAVGALITSYQAGVFLAGSVSYLFGSWRQVFFIGACPAILVILLRLTLRESDRWLEKQKIPVAERVEASLLSQLWQSDQRVSLIVGSLTFGALLIGYWASLAWIPVWIQSLLDTDSHIERSLATAWQGLAAIAGCLAAGFACEYFGRRITISVSFLGCLAASAVLFLMNGEFSELLYLQSGILGFFIGLCQASLYIYLPECFKTLVRATGTGFCLNFGRVVTIMAVLGVGTLVAFFGGYAESAFTFSLFYIVGAVAVLFGKETKDLKLPD
ncbi:MAG: MFS transporter [Candidatus Caenarcaniphilales bacterium]|nr:MFS transporter [Candidatus Caenarcaniphilales bacterium]